MSKIQLDYVRALSTALDLASHGIAVFPVRLTWNDEKQKYIKTPVASCVPNGHLSATTDLNLIREWWEAEPESAVGARNGRAFGNFVIDIDSTRSPWLAKHIEARDLPCRLVNRTSKGFHFVFKYPSDQGITIKRHIKKLTPEKDVDVLGEDGWTCFWSSVGLKSSGSIAQIKAAPSWLLQDILKIDPIEAPKSSVPTSYAPTSREEASKALSCIPNDGTVDELESRDQWFRLCFSFRAAGGSYHEWLSWCRQHRTFSARDCVRTWNSWKPGSVGAGYLFKLARQHGYSENTITGNPNPHARERFRKYFSENYTQKENE